MIFLFSIYFLIFLIQLYYYGYIFRKFSSLKHKANSLKKNTAVSVLVCAKNEEKNLKNLVPKLLNQNYSNFEIVLINDSSFDDTLEVMEQFKENHPDKIRIVNVSENLKFRGFKKFALTLGIKAAKNEILLFTDADCIPASPNWISEMTQNISEDININLGYGAYKKIKGSFLNKIIRFETLMTALQYFSYAKNKTPYMGVGRNLAYTKSLFFDANGFGSHMHIKSGDDDLFINENATSENTAICFSEDSFTISEPKLKLKDWLKQKRRHISTANQYKKKHKTLLGLYYISQILFWSLTIFLFLTQYEFWYVTLFFSTIRTTIQYITINNTAKKLNEKDIVIGAPFYEIILILLQLFIFIQNKISKPTHW